MGDLRRGAGGVPSSPEQVRNSAGIFGGSGHQRDYGERAGTYFCGEESEGASGGQRIHFGGGAGGGDSHAGVGRAPGNQRSESHRGRADAQRVPNQRGASECGAERTGSHHSKIRGIHDYHGRAGAAEELDGGVQGGPVCADGVRIQYFYQRRNLLGQNHHAQRAGILHSSGGAGGDH